MIISPEHLLLPEWKQIHINRLLKLPPLQREQQLRHIATINILLVAKCLTSIRRPSIEFKEEIKALAVSQFQTLQDKDRSKRALLALYELKGYPELTEIFKNISQPEPIHRSLLINILQNATTEFTFKLLDILFENYHLTLSESAHQLWQWAVEALPDDLPTYSQIHRLLEIYIFFAQQEIYSDTLNLFYEKFQDCQSKFIAVLEQPSFERKLRKFYLRYAKRDRNQLNFCYEKLKEKQLFDIRAITKLVNYSSTFEQAFGIFEDMKSKGVALDQISYSTLINKAKTFDLAFEIFQEMKSKGLTPNEISYNTLINKAKTFELAFGIFEEMKSKGLTPNEISYSTLINKAKTFEQAFGIFEDMKSKGLILDVITFNTLLKKATETGKPLRIILDILEEMIAYQIAPNVESSKPYTLFAISAKLRLGINRQPFKAWAMHQETKLAQLPPHIRNAWQILFDAFN